MLFELVPRVASDVAVFVVGAELAALAARGRSHARIAREPGLHLDTVRTRRRRFAEEGISGLTDRKRSGRSPSFTALQAAQVKALACQLPAETGAAVPMVMPGAGREAWRAAPTTCCAGGGHGAGNRPPAWHGTVRTSASAATSRIARPLVLTSNVDTNVSADALFRSGSRNSIRRNRSWRGSECRT
ncbi:helix-turn-helix domain-containing protein [Streptomyces sp. NBC_01238]|uniref:helix-turn-helix domain-containing protein n=1 Tax=unclassified Streptomyces TaxID=2593676 RepID=UPI00386CBBE3